MAIREGRWDCPSCGRTGNRGPDAECPACGAPRGADVPFYLPDDAPEVSDPEAVERARAGADWTCPYCDGDNPASAELCTNCNAPRQDAAERPVLEHRLDAEPTDTPPPPADEPVFAGTPPGGKTKQKRSGCLRTLGCLGLLALALLSALWLTRSEPATATASALRWERSVQVEQRRVERGEAWEDEVPQGAEIFARWQVGDDGPRSRTVSERVQVGTERVKVGVRDLGNGYFEDVYEERPVYDTVERTETVASQARTRVRYQVERWQPVRTERAAGDDGSPAWPAVRLAPDERRGERAESYTVLFATPDGRTLPYRARDETEWRRFRLGRSYRVRLRGDRVRSVEGPG